MQASDGRLPFLDGALGVAVGALFCQLLDGPNFQGPNNYFFSCESLQKACAFKEEARGGKN